MLDVGMGEEAKVVTGGNLYNPSENAIVERK